MVFSGYIFNWLILRKRRVLVLVPLLSLTWYERVLRDPRVRLFTEWKSLSDRSLDQFFHKVESTFSEKPRSVLFLFSHCILGFQSRWCFILFLVCDLTGYFLFEIWWAHLRIWSPQPRFRYVHKILQRHTDMAPLWELTSCWSSTHEFGDHSWVVKDWSVSQSASIKPEAKKNPRFFLHITKWRGRSVHSTLDSFMDLFLF